MLYLSRIYTKSGDQGETSLGDGSRVPKDHDRVTAYGSVDEVNALLGLLAVDLERTQATSAHLELIRSIQNDLFDVGADLCLPANADEKPGQNLRVRPVQAARLEETIDRLNAQLEPLRSFILPGGTSPAGWCHLARTVCRRAERDIVRLARHQAINPQIVIYLNRLSDLLFVLARVLNNHGKNDQLWMPGGQEPRTK